MAILTRYIDASLAPGGDGTSWATAWNGMAVAWPALNTADDYIVYCRGGEDLTDYGSGFTVHTTPLSITFIGDWDGKNIFDATCYRYRGDSANASTGYIFSDLGNSGTSYTFKNFVIDSHPEKQWASQTACLRAYASPVKSGVVLLDSCAIISRGDQTATFGAGSTFRIQGQPKAIAVNCIFRQIHSTIFGDSSNVTFNFDDVAGAYGYLSNCILDSTDDTNTPVGTNGSNVGSFSGQQSRANRYVANCISLRQGGRDFSYITLIKNCVSNGIYFNVGTVTDSITLPLATRLALFTDPNNGDYTIADTANPDANLLDTGTTTEAETGISTDIFGNDRNDPRAGAAWDIGVYEFGFESPHSGSHEVTDISQSADPECIYFGQAPAIQVGDLFSFKETTETNGWGVSIDAQGFPIIDTGGATGTDSFLFNISRDSGSTWDPTPPASDSWLFAVAPTLSSPTVVATETDGATLSIDTNSSAGRLYLAVRTLAQGGAYGPAEQVAIRDGVIGVDCEFKDSLLAPSDAAPNQFVVSGLDPSTDYYFGFAQDADAV